MAMQLKSKIGMGQPQGRVTISVTFREIPPEPLPFVDVTGATGPRRPSGMSGKMAW